jgi:hypothetical protein
MVMMHLGKANCCHPIHCAMPNKYAGKNMVRFNDRPFKDGEVPSNGEDLSGNDKMSKDSDDDDDDGGCGGGVREKRGDNAKQWRRFEW